MLLVNGADANARDGDSNTPLLNAALAGNDALVSALLKRKAKINNVDRDGATALHKAAFAGATSTVVRNSHVMHQNCFNHMFSR